MGLDISHFEPIAPKALDSSMIGTWLSCPRKFYLSYVLGLRPKGDKIALSYGSLWHEVMQTAFSTSFEDAFNLIDTNHDTFPLNDSKNRTAARMKGDFFQYIKEYGEVDSKNKILALEKGFDLELPNGIPYCGLIDRIFQLPNTRIQIMDHKSTTFFTKHYFNNLELGIQFKGYVWALQQLHGTRDINTVVADVYHILKSETKFYRRELKFFDSQIDEWENNMCRITDQIWSGLQDHLYDPEWWHLNSGQRCADYGGCEFQLVHQLPPRKQNRERLLKYEFEVVRWDPIEHEEIENENNE